MQHAIDTLVRQFEQGRLTRRQLVQGLLVVAASPGVAQQPPAGAFLAAGIEHVQITVDDLKASQQFYEKLLGVKGRNPSATQVNIGVCSSRPSGKKTSGACGWTWGWESGPTRRADIIRSSGFENAAGRSW